MHFNYQRNILVAFSAKGVALFARCAGFEILSTLWQRTVVSLNFLDAHAERHSV